MSQVPLYGLRATQPTMGAGQGLLGGLGQQTVAAAPASIPQFKYEKKAGLPQFAPRGGGGTTFAGGPKMQKPSTAQRIAQGGMGVISGATAGATLGPIGAIVGGVLGGALGGGLF